MDSLKDEKRIIRYIYLLCIVCFGNLALLKNPFDEGAVLIGIIIIVLIAYSQFIIRKFYPDGDKYILIFASILSVIGIAVIYRLNPTLALKQVMWFALGVSAFIIIIVLFPDLKSFQKYKYIYLALTLIFMSMALIFGTERGGLKTGL